MYHQNNHLLYSTVLLKRSYLELVVFEESNHRPYLHRHYTQSLNYYVSNNFYFNIKFRIYYQISTIWFDCKTCSNRTLCFISKKSDCIYIAIAPDNLIVLFVISIFLPLSIKRNRRCKSVIMNVNCIAFVKLIPTK